MHSVLWASILASAGVALVTTLLVEYLAKPRLEVRKERILEVSREQRAGKKDILLSMHLAMRLLSFIVGEGMGQISDEYISKAKTELSDRVTNAYRVLMPPKSIIIEWVRITLVIEAFALTFNMELSAEEVGEYLYPAVERLQLFHDYFDTRKWHKWRRRKLIRKIESMQVDIEEALETTDKTIASLIRRPASPANERNT